MIRCAERGMRRTHPLPPFPFPHDSRRDPFAPRLLFHDHRPHCHRHHRRCRPLATPLLASERTLSLARRLFLRKPSPVFLARDRACRASIGRRQRGPVRNARDDREGSHQAQQHQRQRWRQRRATWRGESPTSLWASTRASPARTRACLPCARERGEAPRGGGDRRREEEEALTADVARAEVDAEADAEGVEVQSSLVDGRNCSAALRGRARRLEGVGSIQPQQSSARRGSESGDSPPRCASPPPRTPSRCERSTPQASR